GAVLCCRGCSAPLRPLPPGPTGRGLQQCGASTSTKRVTGRAASPIHESRYERPPHRVRRRARPWWAAPGCAMLCDGSRWRKRVAANPTPEFDRVASTRLTLGELTPGQLTPPD